MLQEPAQPCPAPASLTPKRHGKRSRQAAYEERSASEIWTSITATMFSYVAKSLLSKTLQTFLRKYLENIELESISYGSNPATVENNPASGSNSGWGVRLSNVKLREGMELMKLPGKRKRRVVVKKKVRRRKKKRGDKKKAGGKPEGNQNGKKSPMKVRRSLSQGNPMVDTSAAFPKAKSNRHFIDKHLTQTSGHEPQTEYRKRSMSSGSEFDYFSSAPSTPVQQRAVICGAPLSFCSGSRSKKASVKVEEKDLNVEGLPLLPFDSPYRLESQDSTQDVNTTRHKAVDIPCTQIDPGIDRPPDSVFRSNLGSFETDDSDDESAADSVIEVEEEDIIEDTMSLVVGAGGAIGTLNIRLVGKELHVTVEDAHLIIEALPIRRLNVNTNATDSEVKANLRSDSTVSEASVEPAADENVDKTTIGEKIKKKSVLARYLSMVPRLFLRDCRVSLILPGESDFDEDDETTVQSMDDCTVFEFGVDFLSVTSGDDLIDVLRLDTGNRAPEKSPTDSNGTKGKNHNTNIFSRKRIRTGKGPDGGLWLKIHPPNDVCLQSNKGIRNNQDGWARSKFLDSSAGFFFRCSGLDLHARMLVEVKDEVEDEIAAAWSSEYDDYTMDSMLFGVDYVDPITLTRHQLREKLKREKLFNPNTTTKSRMDTDANGIHHIPFASNFYWISQNTHRKDCSSAHLPLYECHHCWNACVLADSSKYNSPMDGVMPLPGFVFYLSMTDTLELNVDRNNLEALSYATSLLSEQSTIDPSKPNSFQKSPVKRSSTFKQETPCQSKDDAFPSFMQPDATFISGIHLCKVVVRVHAMQPHNDSGLRFRYWQLVLESLCLEEQQIDSDELSIRDATFHGGLIECTDFTGVCERRIITSGSGHDFHLPFTAPKLLGASIPSDHDTCAFHARIVVCGAPHIMNEVGNNEPARTGFVKMNTGATNVNMDDTLFGDMSSAANEAVLTLFPKSKEKKNSGPSKRTDEKPCSNSELTWLFQVSTKRGYVSYSPVMQVDIPEADFSGKSGSSGLSFDTFLQGLGIKYGAQKQTSSQCCLCSLPETLRMHVLVFLSDLSPLERVLNINPKKNVSAFLRGHAINKKLSAMKSSQEVAVSVFKKNFDSRTALLKQLQDLDDDVLEELLNSMAN